LRTFGADRRPRGAGTPSDESGPVRVPAAVACGKVILLGEHAVVYGVPAIAVGIEHGVRAQARPLERGPSRLLVREWGVDVAACDEDAPSSGAVAAAGAPDLGRALGAILRASAFEEPVAIEAQVDLPPGGGLGCSAALGVAVARALDATAMSDVIAERVMAWERVFHGNPSGIDAACAARGGCISFTKGEGFETVPVGSPLTLCIGHSGAASSTKSMVEAVARLRARRPEVVQKTFDGIRSLVRNARLAIEAGDRIGLGRLMDLNQMLLSGLFVSTEEIERLCDLARAKGALGAKLTGAGGGGCVVALVNGASGAESVLEAWRGAGFEGFATRVASARQPEALISDSAP
jgi:mevalonate kinase